ncbi:zf-GRF domain-containing protein [Mycena indigotica]|uniref:Zf-GRF domain-containing protein n=1 Tax=Mycena indigotica TaxID=2126181 RepID=A0A8H6TDM6_9AGAR|nr:zf-GRF domain-containing protein [Mycena indigotica]KAF7315486.1 zf-GRF domain-containing protein [Mycena indigotica]
MSSTIEVRCSTHPETQLPRRVSKSVKNPDRAYYKCAIDPCKFFKWEDEIVGLGSPFSSQNTSSQNMSPPTTPSRKRVAESELGPPAKRQSSIRSPAAQARRDAIMRATGHQTASDPHSALSPSPAPNNNTLPSWVPPRSQSMSSPTVPRTEGNSANVSPHQPESDFSEAESGRSRGNYSETIMEDLVPSGSDIASDSSELVASFTVTKRSSTDDSSLMTATHIRSLERSLKAAEMLNEAYLFNIQCLKEEIAELKQRLGEGP